MTDMLDYIKSFSKTKKVFFALSIVLFVYELIGAVYIFIDLFVTPYYYLFPFYYENNNIIASLVESSYFCYMPSHLDFLNNVAASVMAIYCIAFPFVFFILNYILLNRKRYNKKSIIVDCFFQILHPFTFQILPCLLMIFMDIVESF